MQAQDLFWIIPGYVSGGFFTVYFLGRTGAFLERDTPQTKVHFSESGVIPAFIFWPLVSFLLMAEIPIWFARLGHKAYCKKMQEESRAKDAVLLKKKNEEDALRLLEAEMGETIEQTVVRRLAEKHRRDFEKIWSQIEKEGKK